MYLYTILIMPEYYSNLYPITFISTLLLLLLLLFLCCCTPYLEHAAILSYEQKH